MTNLQQNVSTPVFLGAKYEGGLALVNLGNVLAVTVHGGPATDEELRVSVVGAGAEMNFLGEDARYFLRMLTQVGGFRTPEGEDLDL